MRTENPKTYLIEEQQGDTFVVVLRAVYAETLTFETYVDGPWTNTLATWYRSEATPAVAI